MLVGPPSASEVIALTLREGWNVQNVTVVVDLRPYTAKANILPEQTIGRGIACRIPTLQRVPPGYRFPYGQTHRRQEEVYVVVHGSGRMKLDDEIVEFKAVGRGARPACWGGYEAGADSARLRAKTSRASAPGGLTSPSVPGGGRALLKCG